MTPIGPTPTMAERLTAKLDRIRLELADPNLSANDRETKQERIEALSAAVVRLQTGTQASYPIAPDMPCVVATREGSTYGPQIYGYYGASWGAEIGAEEARGYHYEGITIVTVAEAEAQIAAYWSQRCAASLKEIDAERFDYLLNVLPPRNFTNSPEFVSFTMSERLTGSIAEQVVRAWIGGCSRYFTKEVDTQDRATWITYRDLIAVHMPGLLAE